MKTFEQIKAAIAKLPSLRGENTRVQNINAARNILADLNEQGAHGETIGMTLAYDRYSEEVADYLDQLGILLAKGVPAQEILAHLHKTSCFVKITEETINNPNRTLPLSLASIITYYHPWLANQYLLLLVSLLEKGVSASEIMDHLNKTIHCDLMPRAADSSQRALGCIVLLDSLLKKGAPAKEILQQLTKHNTNEPCLLRIIALSQDTAEIIKSHALLNTLLNSKDISANDIWDALNKSGHFVKKEALESYIDLVCALLQKGLPFERVLPLLKSSAVQTKLLSNTRKYASVIYSLAAKNKWVLGDAGITEDLQSCLVNQINAISDQAEKVNAIKNALTPASTLYNLLFANGTTIKVLENIFDWLYLLKMTGSSPTNILVYLNKQSKDGWTLGMTIARCLRNEDIQHYFEWLNHLLDKGIPAQEILKHLDLQNNVNATLGMIIARNQNAKTTNAYLELINTLFEKGVPAHLILNHLSKKINGATLGTFIAKNNAEALETFINLLCRIYDKGFKYNIYVAELVNSEIVKILLSNPKKYVSAIYELARRNLLPSDIRITNELQTCLLEKINAITDKHEKLLAVKSALNPGSDLHKLMSAKSFLRFSNKNSFIEKLNVMQHELTNKVEAQRTTLKDIELAFKELAKVKAKTQTWCEKLPNINAIRRHLVSDSCDFNEKDSADMSFKSFAYASAAESPFIFYFLLDEMPAAHLPLFSSMQDKLFALFMHEDMPINRRVDFLIKATTESSRLHTFMGMKSGMLETLRKNVKETANLLRELMIKQPELKEKCQIELKKLAPVEAAIIYEQELAAQTRFTYPYLQDIQGIVPPQTDAIPEVHATAIVDQPSAHDLAIDRLQSSFEDITCYQTKVPVAEPKTPVADSSRLFRAPIPIPAPVPIPAAAAAAPEEALYPEVPMNPPVWDEMPVVEENAASGRVALSS